MKYILLNLKTNSFELLKKNNILNDLYYFKYEPISQNDIDKYKKTNKKNNIYDIIHANKYVDKFKKNISKIESHVPLYDTYTNNLFLIDKYDVYHRVTNKYFRFPSKELLFELNEKQKNTVIDKDDVLEIRNMRKCDLMLKFMSYFNIDILYNTYINVFYKYSKFVGMEITTCKRPSFLPQFHHITPYFTLKEIQNIALNNRIDTKMDQNKLCNAIIKNEINYQLLLIHKKYMLSSGAIDLVRYYTLQGSSTINKYLRNLTNYDYQNIHLENIINPMWKLVLQSPEFDKNYVFYRFVHNDFYLENLKIGDVYTEQGFLSTTRDPFYNADFGFGFILIKIKIPKNIKGVALCLETISHFSKEQEIIFPPNSSFKLKSKNLDCVYHHYDKNFISKVKTKYEFDWIKNDKIKFERTKKDINYNVVDFINIEKNNSKSFIDKITTFINKYVINDLFKIKIKDKQITIVSEQYDSTNAYAKYYAVSTANGYALYSLHNGHVIFFIEIVETNNKMEMHINFHVKHSEKNIDNVISDAELLMLYSSIAHYFDIHVVYIYTIYVQCDDIFNGSYSSDFYQYFTTDKKKYGELNILNSELHPVFSYYDLDLLKTISPDRILEQDDGEIYQIYHKIYKENKNTNSIADFYVWLKDIKCYLLSKLISKINNILTDNNPFKNENYALDPMLFLYNRKYISLYSSRFSMSKKT